MFEAYKVAVKITLVNEVSKNLTAISALFGKIGKDVDILQSKLDKLKKVGIVSGMAAGTGFLGLDLVRKSLKPAEEYAHQLNIMNMAGMKHKEIAEATAAAWKTAGTNLTTTATGNLKTILDLRNVFGHAGEAIQYLPELARIQTVLKASSESGVRDNAEGLSYSLAKALDIRNAVTNPRMFSEQAEAMAKVITALQGRVLPVDYQMLFKYGRQAIPGLSNEFLYQQLPTFMMEMKGKQGSGGQGGFGAVLAAGYRFFVQGIMNKRAAENLADLGLIPSSSILKTTTTGTTLKGGVKNAALFQANPFQWVQEVFLPAIRNKYGENLSNQQLTQIINQTMKGNQLAQFEILQYALKAQNVYRDQKIIQEAMDSNNAFKMAMSNDPTIAMAAFNAQWQNFQTAFTAGVIPVIVPALISLTRYLNEFAEWARAHPNIAKDLALGFIGLNTVLVTLGTVGFAAATIGIYRLSAAIATLNTTLAASKVGGAGVGASAGVAARAAGAGALAVGGGIAAAVGLIAYDIYKLYPILAGVIHNQRGMDLGFDAALHGTPSQPAQHAGAQSNTGTPAQITIQVDGRSLMQTILPHLNQNMYHAQIQQPNSFIMGMTPIAPNTGAPLR